MHRINGLDPYEQALIEETVGEGADALVKIVRRMVELVKPEHRSAVTAAILACTAQQADGITTACHAKVDGVSGRLIACVSTWRFP